MIKPRTGSQSQNADRLRQRSVGTHRNRRTHQEHHCTSPGKELTALSSPGVSWRGGYVLPLFFLCCFLPILYLESVWTDGHRPSRSIRAFVIAQVFLLRVSPHQTLGKRSRTYSTVLAIFYLRLISEKPSVEIPFTGLAERRTGGWHTQESVWTPDQNFKSKGDNNKRDDHNRTGQDDQTERRKSCGVQPLRGKTNVNW